MYKYLISFFLTIYSLGPVVAQKTMVITKSQEEIIKTQARELLGSYSENLNLMGREDLKSQRTFFVNDIIQNLFENDKTIVSNDLDPYKKSESDLTIKNYLDRLYVLYPKGITVTYLFLNVSDVFYNEKENYLFLKVEIQRTLEGLFNKNQAIRNKEALDFYLKFFINGEKINDNPRIFSIDEHQENLSTFTKTEVKDESMIRKELETEVIKLQNKIEEMKAQSSEAQEQQLKAKNEADYANTLADATVRRALGVSKRNYKMGGPGSALYSFIMPGLGNFFVNSKYQNKDFILKAASVGLLVAGGVLFENRSEKLYNKYQSSLQPVERSDLYYKANLNHKISFCLLTAGGLIWVSDIVQVFRKGLENDKAIKKVKNIPNIGFNKKALEGLGFSYTGNSVSIAYKLQLN
jgi:hypothetical protein